uniref:Reverse transcriptase domain-containing protein n=1 Tax=Tanacetum cinerariifolium TaxID=118510 RepID=A0A6L2LP92_TANCI|nr:hypothetical protein [Tanacetum cinerariifolium]
MGEIKPIITCFMVALGMKNAQASGGVGKLEAIKNLAPLAYAGKYDSRVDSPTRRKVTDIKEKNKIEAKTGENQAQNGKRGQVNQVKAKVKVKPVKTGHGFGKSMKNQSQRRKYLIRLTVPELMGRVNPIYVFAIAITLNLPTVEPKDFLIMRDEHLNTVSKKKLDEFIKSSVKNLIPSLSESEDECECDVSVCYDFTTFSNLLFDTDDDFSSSDDKSCFDEDISKEIYSNPLFDEGIISMKIDLHNFNAEFDLIESLLNHDSLIISSSSKIDSFLDEFDGELILLKSIPSGIDEADCDPKEEIRFIEKLLYDNSSPRPPEEFIFENSDAAIESFSPFPIPVEDSDTLRDKIDLSLTPDDSMPPGIENDEYESEGDILILEELLSNDFCPDNPPRLQIRRNLLISHRGLKAFQLSSESPMMIYGGKIPILDVLFLHFYPP